jgi:hypothetical protein
MFSLLQHEFFKKVHQKLKELNLIAWHSLFSCLKYDLTFSFLSPGSINATKPSFFLVQQNDKMLYFLLPDSVGTLYCN